MASRRMFSLDIVDSDNFLDMPSSSRCLYYDLGMRADDDGFVNSRKVIRLTNVTEDDLKILIAKKYVLPFKSGVVVITHWKRNNFIRGDRYQPTMYQQEKLQLTDDDSTYLIDVPVSHTAGMPLGIPSIGKDRVGKVSKELDIYASFIQFFNQYTKKKYGVNKNNIANFEYWLKQYSLEQMRIAIKLAMIDEWWKDKLTPERLLRQRNQNGPCDNIGDLLNKYEGKYELNNT